MSSPCTGPAVNGTPLLDRVVPDDADSRTTVLEPEKTTREFISSFTAGATVAAAVAPALCAVHCAAMPVIAVALPALQGSKFLNVCPHSMGRKLLCVVAPLVLLSSAVGYSKHKSSATTSAALLGLSSMTAAASVKQLAPHRNVLNGIGCVLMLGASYRGRLLEEEIGETCCTTHMHTGMHSNNDEQASSKR